MADGVVLNAGAGGVTAATDDAGAAGHVQIVKLAISTDGSATAIPAEATNGLDVDVTRVIPGTSATHLGKAEDAAHAGGDTGVMMLAVRQDTAAALATTDGDYIPLITDSTGKLHVNVGNTVTVGSHAVTNAGTFVTQENGAALTSLQLIDDTVFAEDVAAQAADKGIAVLAVRRDADTSLVGTDNDYANLQVNATGSLKVAITSGAGSGGTSIADGASFTRDTTSITVAGAVVESSAPTLTNGDAAGLSQTTAGALRVAIASGGVAGAVEDAAAAGGEEGVMMLAVRRDAASSGVSADGDFAALSVTSDGSLRVSGSSGTTQYAEDAAHVSGDQVVVMGAVRRDTAAVGSGTDGDYSTINVDANGRLHVNVGVSALPTNATTATVQAQIATSLANLELALHQEDVAHSTGQFGLAMWAVRRDADTTLVDTTGDYAPLQVNTAGALKVAAFGGAAHDAAVSGGPVLGGASASAAAPADVSADGDAVNLWALRNGSQVVNLAHGGTLVTATTTQECVGDVAHDAAAAGNPVQIGGYATNAIEGVTQVAAADLTRTVHDLNGVIVTRPHTTLEEIQSVRTTNTDGASTSLIGAAGAGIHNYITQVTIWNSSATDGFVDFRDGTAGSVIYTFPAPQTGGCAVSFNPPLKFGDNTAVAYDASAAITTIYISAVYFQAQG